MVRCMLCNTSYPPEAWSDVCYATRHNYRTKITRNHSVPHKKRRPAGKLLCSVFQFFLSKLQVVLTELSLISAVDQNSTS